MEKKKYIIAFVPQKNFNKYNKLSKKKINIHNYQLGIYSIPHVTIAQFYLEKSRVKDIWLDVCSQIPQKHISLSFKKTSNVSFDGEVFWFSLIPEQITPLKEIHTIVSQIVRSIRTDEYDPHLTLFNYILTNLESKLVQSDIFMRDTFELVLGICDEVGQLRKILIKAVVH